MNGEISRRSDRGLDRPVGVYMYFSTGSAPVATSSAPMPFERVLAGWRCIPE